MKPTASSIWMTNVCLACLGCLTSLTSCGDAENNPRGGLPLQNDIPIFSLPELEEISENGSQNVLSLFAVDDGQPQPLTFSLPAGVGDNDRFEIATGTSVLRFRNAFRPDFEQPTDSNRDNDYVVSVTVSDGVSAVSDSMVVRVRDREESFMPRLVRLPAGAYVQGDDSETPVMWEFETRLDGAGDGQGVWASPQDPPLEPNQEIILSWTGNINNSYSFFYRVVSDNGNAAVTFKINGVTIDDWSNQIEWLEFGNSIPNPLTDVTLSWHYEVTSL